MSASLEDSGHVVRAGAWGVTVVGPGFEYWEHAPPADLRDLVACFWRSRVTAPEGYRLRVLPDGCAEVVFAPDGDAVVFGPAASWYDLPLPAGASFVGLRLLPGAAGGLLGIDAVELSRGPVPLSDVVRTRPGSSPLGWARAARAPVADGVATQAARLLQEAPALRAQELARRVGIGERQLRRRFARSVGIAPSTFARIARMHRALGDAASEGSPWASVAYRNGFADQAHLSREIAALTGLNPTALVRRSAV